MVEIIDFPTETVREWVFIEEEFRRTYSDVSDGPGTVEEALPAVRRWWDMLFVPFSIHPQYQLPWAATEEQLAAIEAAVGVGVQLMADRLKSERAKYFSALATLEFKAAYTRRNGWAA